MNGRFRSSPASSWKNNFPIVLVHGYFGYGPDASFILGNYFEYAFQKQVAKHHEGDIYIAVISPIAGYHDRACELYQSLVGITNFKKMHGIKLKDNGPNLVRAVYGEEHACQEHSK